MLTDWVEPAIGTVDSKRVTTISGYDLIESVSTFNMETKKTARKPEPKGSPPKGTTDYFRQRIEQMVQNADKPIIIPERPTETLKAPKPKEYFPNVMGM